MGMDSRFFLPHPPRCSGIYWIALLGLYPVVALSLVAAVRRGVAGGFAMGVVWSCLMRRFTEKAAEHPGFS